MRSRESRVRRPSVNFEIIIGGYKYPSFFFSNVCLSFFKVWWLKMVSTKVLPRAMVKNGIRLYPFVSTNQNVSYDLWSMVSISKIPVVRLRFVIMVPLAHHNNLVMRRWWRHTLVLWRHVTWYIHVTGDIWKWINRE